MNFGAGMTAFESADAEHAAETFPFDKSDRKGAAVLHAACTGGQNLAFAFVIEIYEAGGF